LAGKRRCPTSSSSLSLSAIGSMMALPPSMLPNVTVIRSVPTNDQRFRQRKKYAVVAA
jgi:hypothetical protein